MAGRWGGRASPHGRDVGQSYEGETLGKPAFTHPPGTSAIGREVDGEGLPAFHPKEGGSLNKTALGEMRNSGHSKPLGEHPGSGNTQVRAERNNDVTSQDAMREYSAGMDMSELDGEDEEPAEDGIKYGESGQVTSEDEEPDSPALPAKDGMATDPPVSQAQRRWAFANKDKGGSEGKAASEFANADPGGKLPAHAHDARPSFARGVPNPALRTPAKATVVLPD